MQGTWIRQKANGQQVRSLLWSPSGQLSLLSREQTCPSSPSPASGLFSQHLSETKKNQACQNQGSVFNIIMKAVKTVNITQNQREKRRTSRDKCWERRPALPLSAIPGGYRNPLVFSLGAQAAETWCPNQWSGDPKWRVWGGGVSLETVEVIPQVQGLEIVWVSPPSTWVRILYPKTTYLLFTCSLSCLPEFPWKFPASELRVLP